MEEWKSIATAPKDGREVRVKRDGMEATVRWAPPFDDWAVEYQGELSVGSCSFGSRHIGGLSEATGGHCPTASPNERINAIDEKTIDPIEEEALTVNYLTRWWKAVGARTERAELWTFVCTGIQCIRSFLPAKEVFLNRQGTAACGRPHPPNPASAGPAEHHRLGFPHLPGSHLPSPHTWPQGSPGW
jgi:hypothetical protein